MKTVSMNEAKIQLSHLIDQAAEGEPFVIAKNGKPIVKVVPLAAPTDADFTRLGFLAGKINVPDNFDQMGDAEIERMFGLDSR